MQVLNSENTVAKTYVDDNICVTRPKPHQTMDTIGNYMNMNRLLLNKDKSNIMLVTKDGKIKDTL